MIDLGMLKGSSFVVLGLARSGLATVRALKAAGSRLCCLGRQRRTRARPRPGSACPSPNPRPSTGRASTALIISPGIPNRLPKPHPVAAAARAAGKKIICDIELLARAQPQAGFVGITGTNGKSTTTALIGHILAEAGRRCEVGGNIGRGALDLAPLGPGGVYVLELSSYQLELLDTFRAHVAVWLNITPDHIDRHGDMAGYVAAKENIFARQQPGDCAVIGIDDQASRAVYDKMAARSGIVARAGGARAPVAGGVSFRAGMLIDADGYTGRFRRRADPAGRPQCAERRLRLGGLPLARCAAREDHRRACSSYPGLPHRQERVAAVGNVVYVNDSKATNADATARALSSYRDIYWILGGQAKEGGVAPLAPSSTASAMPS